jgi:hypothetical protein
MPLEPQPLETVPVAPTYVPPAVEISAGSLISRVFTVWKENMWRFLGFTVVGFLPIFVLAMIAGVVGALSFSRGGEPNYVGIVAVVVVGIPVAILFGLVWSGGLTYGTIQSLAGRPVRFGTMFSVGFSRSLSVFGAGFVAGLAILLGMVLLVVPGVILACGYAAVLGVAVTERVGPIEAMQRSWSLTSGYKGTIFATAFLMMLISVGFSLVASVIQLIPIIGLLIGLFINLLVSSLGAIWPAVVYHDLRVSREGAATDDLAKVFE